MLGLLDQSLLATGHSLAEARVIFELAKQPRWERSALRIRLGMDASFLTRVVGRLVDQGLVMTTPSVEDRRALDLSLTGAGRRAYQLLDERSTAQIAEILAPLSGEQRSTLTESMTVILNLIQPDRQRRQISVRGLEPGDSGWVIERHGAVYRDEFGWGLEFEALVARIVADYHANLKPGREQAWIAEVDGARAGCVFCCERDAETAQLRILLVERWARGLGLGSRLVGECIDFARSAGYSKVVLWTNDPLVDARRIYERVGFELAEVEEHHSFGYTMVGQNWELDLR